MGLTIHRRKFGSRTAKIQWYQLLILFIFPILSYYGYKYNGFNLTLLKALYFCVVPLMIMYVGNLFWNAKLHQVPYFSLMGLITLSTIFSMFMAYVFWNQDIVLSYRVTAPYLAVIFYFYLIKTRPTLETLEFFIWLYTGIYILLWLYGTSQAPVTVFGDPEDIVDDSRGIFRLHIPGKAILVLALFFSVNTYITTKRSKFLILAALLFAVIVAHVIRQVILWSFLVSIYFLLRSNTRVWFYMVFVGILCIFFIEYIEIPKDSIIGNLVSLTEDQLDNQKSGEDDVRIRAYSFFFNDYSKNIITDIFGNGMPHANSAYGNYYVNLVQESYRFFLSDVGYAQMFALTGWVGLCLYLYLFYKVIKQTVSPRIVFAKLFIIYQIFSNIAASWYTHDTVLIAICIYLLTMDGLRKKMR